MMEKEQVETILRRIFKGGPLRRMPKKREDADLVLALSLVGLDPVKSFDESDINVQLSAWLDGIAQENSAADYVAMRRDLVDHGFLRRATDGAIYRIEQARVDEIIAPSARDVDPKAIYAEVLQIRQQRREAFRQ